MIIEQWLFMIIGHDHRQHYATTDSDCNVGVWKANVASMRKGLCSSSFVGSVRCCGTFHLLHVAYDECQPNGNDDANAADNPTDANGDACAANGGCRQ